MAFLADIGTARKIYKNENLYRSAVEISKYCGLRKVPVGDVYINRIIMDLDEFFSSKN
jgi:hypothetical protein